MNCVYFFPQHFSQSCKCCVHFLCPSHYFAWSNSIAGNSSFLPWRFIKRNSQFRVSRGCEWGLFKVSSRVCIMVLICHKRLSIQFSVFFFYVCMLNALYTFLVKYFPCIWIAQLRLWTKAEFYIADAQTVV